MWAYIYIYTYIHVAGKLCMWPCNVVIYIYIDICVYGYILLIGCSIIIKMFGIHHHPLNHVNVHHGRLRDREEKRKERHILFYPKPNLCWPINQIEANLDLVPSLVRRRILNVRVSYGYRSTPTRETSTIRRDWCLIIDERQSIIWSLYFLLKKYYNVGAIGSFYYEADL